MIIFIVISICCLVVTFLYTFSNKNCANFKKCSIKFLEPVPLFGNMFGTLFRKEPFYKTMEKLYNSFPNERYVGFFEFTNPVLFLKDFELIIQITIEHFEYFSDHRSRFSKNIDPLFSNSLFALKGQKWKDMRSTLSPTFTSSKMKLMFPLIANCSKNVVQYLKRKSQLHNTSESNEVIEIEGKNFFTMYANDVIATCAFGIDLNTLKNNLNTFYTMGKKITEISLWYFIKFIGYLTVPTLMKFLNVGFMKQEVADFFKNLVKDTMKLRQRNNIYRADMIQLLMETKIDTGKERNKEWNDDELASQAFVFFLAGYETVSTLLSFAFYELSMQQNIQNSLRNEINYKLKSNKELTYEMLFHMKYLDMFVSEVLRYWPPVIGVNRVCVKKFELPPPNENTNKAYQISPGDFIFIPIRSLHRDPKYFDKPNDFIPERFSNDRFQYNNQLAFISFGIGPRSCIGSRFALMEVKIILVYLIKQFIFMPCSKTENPLTAKINFSGVIPKNGIWIALKSINDK